jgi:hypothetical protein
MPYGYRGLKIFTSLSLRFQDFQRGKGLKETPQQLLTNQLNADGSEVNRQLIRWVKALIQSCAVQMHARAYLSRLSHNL